MASYKHMENGKVQITVTHGKNFDGKPKRYYRTVEYSTNKQLEIEAAVFLADVINGNAAASCGCTIDTLFKDFIKNHREDIAMKTSTAERYLRIYENQIKPYLGNRTIKNISKTDLRNWVRFLSTEYKNKRTQKPLAQKTVKNSLALLSAMYTYAVYDLEIIATNPCTKIRVPKSNVISRAEKSYYTEAEVAVMIMKLSEAIDNPRNTTHATLIMLILMTGMRTGEVMGLKWSDVDLLSNTLKIERERIYVGGKIIEDTPKTESSLRTITFPSTVGDMLKRLKTYQDDCRIKFGSSYTNSDFVAISTAGNPMHPRGTYKWFKGFLARNGLKDTTVHDLRHTHAAMLSSIGVKIIDVSKRLGHSNTRVTQEVYEYLFKDIGDDISIKLDEFINQSQRDLTEESKNVGGM